jgi:hypothetical protein
LRKTVPSTPLAIAGHSLQGDTPLELAAITEDIVFSR